jgi:hypothetical protein
MRKIPLSRPFLAGLLACQVLFAVGCGSEEPENLDACQTAADCNDHNACTTDSCSAGKCSNPAVDPDDGDACTADACDATDGVSHIPVVVDDGDACTADACDAATGNVSHTPVSVDDGDACTADACDSATGQVSHTPAVVDDGDACTADACDAATGNVSHTPVSVDDGDACTADACDATTGVSHTPVSVDDGDACTTDACDATTGVSHTPVSVDDGNVCTADACDSTTGVSHTAVAVDDGDLCTVDSCDPVSGPSHTPVATDDGISCTADSCDATLGIQNVAVDQSCPAGQYCDATGCAPAGVSQQAGTVVISEFEAFGQQFVELYNPSTTAAVDVHGFTLENAAGQLASLRAPSDPDGTAGDPVSIPAQGFAYGVVNPSGIMPPGIAFVYGAPGDAFTLSSTGDVLAIFSAQGGKLEDVVDFSTFHTDPDTAMGSSDFPGYAGRSTQVDPAHLTAADNDSGANWCTTFYPAGSRARVIDTAGAANGSCNTAVINEAFIDPAGSDDGFAFVELAGPGGMLVGGATVQDIEGKGASAGSSNTTDVATIPAGTRFPVDGLLIIADETGSTGTTAVPNVTAADVIAFDMDAENSGGDALQLVAGDGTLLDVLGDDPLGADLAVATNAFGAMWEGSTAIFVGNGTALARDAVSTDSGDNSADFIGETTPTPGAENVFTPVTITSLSPDNGLFTASTSGVVVTGTGFGPGAKVTFGSAAPVSCTVNSSTQLTCTAPAGPNATAERVDVTVTNTSAYGDTTGALTSGWTWTGVANATAGAVNWCNTQYPSTLTTLSGDTSDPVYGQVYQPGLTDAAGDTALIQGELGYGPQSGGAATDPTSSNAWRYTGMSFNTAVGNNYEYMARLLAPAPATYNYVVRFSLDDGLNYTYCDLDGGSDFSTSMLAVWTVTP